MDVLKKSSLILLPAILFFLIFCCAEDGSESNIGKLQIEVLDIGLVNVEYGFIPSTSSYEVTKGDIEVKLIIKNIGKAPIELEKIVGQFYYGQDIPFCGLDKWGSEINYGKCTIKPNENYNITFLSNNDFAWLGGAKRVLKLSLFDIKGNIIASREIIIPKN